MYVGGAPFSATRGFGATIRELRLQAGTNRRSLDYMALILRHIVCTCAPQTDRQMDQLCMLFDELGRGNAQYRQIDQWPLIHRFRGRQF